MVWSNMEKEKLLEKGRILKDRWRVIKKLTEGAFGQIYRADELETGKEVVIKAAKKESEETHFMVMEVHMLQRLKGFQHIPKFFACGNTSTCNYIIMELLGRNLHQLRQKEQTLTFSIDTAFRFMVQMTEAVESIHAVGYLHRDIKPSNFVVGRHPHELRVYMIDFGLSRSYVDFERQLSSGCYALKPPRGRVGFRGTARYSSINTHECRDMGRRDDIWPLFYILVEMLMGQLPWTGIADREEIKKLKRSVDYASLLMDLPEEVDEFLQLIKPLDFYDQPPYDQFRTLFERAIRSHLQYSDAEMPSELQDSSSEEYISYQNAQCSTADQCCHFSYSTEESGDDN